MDRAYPQVDTPDMKIWSGIVAVSSFAAAILCLVSLLQASTKSGADSLWLAAERLRAEPEAQAAGALTLFSAAGAAGVPVLIDLLDDAHPAIRTFAAKALGHLGPEARPATEALVCALSDSVSSVRLAATSSLGSLESAAGLEGLHQAVGSSDVEVQRQALLALALYHEPDEARAEAILSEAWSASRGETRRLAKSALAYSRASS